ncbi:sensor histidine kinase [Robbsia andropogonis]|uniref:sensor histidine kinase n=1 Tax=Robbsia andropogonis TaxID=28092 RepID=UPI000464CE3F|nr:sensor histidine kinase [Robbsia andropogonis]
MLSSLRARLFGWLLLPLLSFLLISATLSYSSARRTAGLLEDDTLLDAARVIVEAVYWHEGALSAPIPPAALELFESPYQDHIYYRVTAQPIEGSPEVALTDTGARQRLLAGTPDLPMRAAGVTAPAEYPELFMRSPPPLGADLASIGGSTNKKNVAANSPRDAGESPDHDDGGGPPRYFDAMYNGLSLRAVAYDRLVYDAGRTDRVTVVVAKTRASEAGMVQDLWHPQLWRQVLLACLALLLVPVGLTIELKPLIRLRDDVANRDPTALVPLRTAHLPAELRPIVDTINQSIARLKQQASTQRQFIADAAHQMRTPLTVLDTQLQYLQQAGAGSPGWQEALAGIQRTSKRMASMTNQLLMLAQAEAATRHPLTSRVDLAEVIGDVLAEMVVTAERHAIDLGAEWDTSIPGRRDSDGTPVPMPVAGNAGLLNAMILNLVDNAIRYTAAHWARNRARSGAALCLAEDGTHAEVGTHGSDAKPGRVGGQVTVSCRYAVHPGNGDAFGNPVREVVLSVTDNGPGIPAEARAHVFERFYRVHGEVDSDGSGLGLSIVQQIVQAHHGSVALTMPLYTSVPAMAHGAAVAHSNGANATGLCVTVRLPAWPASEERGSI